MAEIKAKHKPKIVKGSGLSYNASTFESFKVANFFEVDTPEEFMSIITPLEYRGRKLISFDTETHPYYRSSQEVPVGHVRRWVGTGKKATPQDFPFCLSVCDGTNAISIFDSVENGFKKFKALQPLFEQEGLEYIAHNWKFDAHMFANIGMHITGRVHDTIVLAKLANENRTSFKLVDLARKHPKGVTIFEDMVDAYKQLAKITDYRDFPHELLVQYANADVWNCLNVFTTEYDKIIADDIDELYDNECELMIALYAMERYGMKVDSEYEEPLKKELQTLTDTAEQAIYDEAGSLFNINSGAQLYEVFMRLGVDDRWIQRTDKGNPILDKNALERLAEKHGVSIVQKILEYRKYEKLLSTYAVGIYEQRDSVDKVHSSINQTEATTGRMSITKPALQTLPKKDKRIRSAFIPDSDEYELWFMDLDQVEYRGFAHYAKAGSLLEAIAAGYDIHAATAADMYGYNLDEFVQHYEAGEEAFTTMRANGKTINFALIYGVGEDHLAELLKCTKTEASEMKARYFVKFPEAKSFISTVHQVIKYRGFVRNFYGRRRRLKADEAYKAPNALIQGWAADYIKHKMVDMYKYICYHGLKTRLINIVHDEIILLVHKDEYEHLPHLRWLLSDFTTYRCPITAGAEVGDISWGQKVSPKFEVAFLEPFYKSYLSYDVYDGSVFYIDKEVN